jgi:predicted Zn-dependent peptidase
MLALSITKKSFEVQRRVVIEEFKETCLNEPYGDAWHHLSDLMYRVHPYRWPVIGLSPEHLEQATIDDVRAFYRRWYTPNNAVLSVAGNVSAEDALPLVQKWFAPIPAGPALERLLPPEPPQDAPRVRRVVSAVPVPAVYLAFRMPARLEADFYAVDLLTDVLAQGASSRLYRRLLKEQPVFAQIDAYVTGNLDPGLLVVEGKPAPGVSPEAALAAVWHELDRLKDELLEARELAKIKNRFESTVVFSETSVLNKAQNLGFYEILDSAEWLNEEVGAYLAITPDQLQRAARQMFRPDNSATLIYVPG